MKGCNLFMKITDIKRIAKKYIVALYDISHDREVVAMSFTHNVLMFLIFFHIVRDLEDPSVEKISFTSFLSEKMVN